MTRRRAATGLALGLAVFALALVALERSPREPRTAAADAPVVLDGSTATIEDRAPPSVPALVPAQAAPAERRPVDEAAAAAGERVVRGRVRGADGAPIPRAWVTAEFAGTSLPLFADAEGRFEWRQPLDSATFTLLVRALGHAGRRLADVAADGTELEVVLERGTFLHASERVVALARPEVEVRRGDEEVFAEVVGDTDGAFRIGPLAPGRYSLICGYPWSEERLVIDALDVLPGQDNRDARLWPLDVARFLATVELSVVDERGVPVRDVVVRTPTIPGLHEDVHATEAPGGALRVEGGPLPLALRLGAPGFRPLDVEVGGNTRVVMRRGPELLLVLAVSMRELPPGWYLAPRLEPEGLVDLAAKTQPARFVAGAAELSVAAPGRYVLSYDLVAPRGDARELHPARELRKALGESGACVIDVADSAVPQQFALLPPSEEDLRRAIDALSAEPRTLFR